MRILGLTIALLLSTPYAKAQNGKLLIIGGGAENITSTTSWNYEAFKWAVSQSTNKKVALLHYSTVTTSSFENYFKTYCGATAVKSFIVNGTSANNSTLINEISEYDVFYFRGGDQWLYYEAWKGKLMEDAIHNKFNSGGVICGTSAGLAILSGTSFVAQNGECYSNGAVKNTNLITITLKNDFLEMMPGYIFDSHFTNRGRMGRLVSFMAHWKKNKGEDLVGIGVDEITALAIAPDGVATAYGAGTVSIFRRRTGNDYGAGTILAIDSLELSQLSHGKSINLKNNIVTGFTSPIIPATSTETTTSTLYLSGGDNIGTINDNMLTKFVSEGNQTDPILIFTGTDLTLANSYRTRLNEFGANNVKVYQATADNAGNTNLAADIQSTSKFVFVKNTAYDLITMFYNSGSAAGNALKDVIANKRLVLAFIGDNARFCGAFTIGNYISADANASISSSLSILKTSVIIPKAYERPLSGTVTTYWHGTNSAIPYTLVKEKVKNGIWLNDDNYIVFKGEGSNATISAFGTSPVVVQSLHNTSGDLVIQTSSGTGVADKKGAFDFMYLSFLKENQKYYLGEYTSTLSGTERIEKRPSITVFPNPITDKMLVKCDKEILMLSIFDIIGSKRFVMNPQGREATVDIQSLNLPKGLYLVELITTDCKKATQKVIVK